VECGLDGSLVFAPVIVCETDLVGVNI
jgi:hypothetical protein